MSTPTALPLLALVAGTVTKAYRARMDRTRPTGTTPAGPAPAGPAPVGPAPVGTVSTRTVPVGTSGWDDAPGTVAARLHALQDHYTYAVNSAVEDGREDLAEQLADRYDAEALAVVGGTRR